MGFEVRATAKATRVGAGAMTGDSAPRGQVRGDPRRGVWIAGSTAVLLLLTVLIGLPVLTSGDGWSAWTVERHEDGTTTVRIRDAREAAALEARLAAAGVPAHVTFAPEGTRCAAGTGPSDVDRAAVSVTHAEDAIVVHAGRLGEGTRLALVAFLLVGGAVAVEAAVVPAERPRCALVPL